MSIKFRADDYEKKPRFQTFMMSAGFGSSSNAYRALAAERINNMGSFLPMKAKLFTKDNLDKDGKFDLKMSEVLRLQGLWMWAYCKRATHGNPEDINWGISEAALGNWVLEEGSLIQKIRSGKGILELIRGNFNLDKADTKNYPQFTGKVVH